MEKQLKQVFDFNKYGGQDVTHTPRLIESEQFFLQEGLIKEELQELREAFMNKDMVEVLDALVDTTFVLFGMVARFGLQNEFVKGFEAVHDNNMTKIFDPFGNKIVSFREDGKIVKPVGYQSVNLGNVFPHLKNIKPE